MPLAALMTETVEIHRYTVTGEDSTGDEIREWALIATVDAFVARSPLTGSQLSTDEEIVGRDQVIAEYAFMVPPDTDVEPYDRVVHLGRTFEVVGLPSVGMKPGVGAQFLVVKTKHVEG